ncbi:MAG TPA: hypothetical protein DEV73_04645 [Candidatus Zambryskibacteria bacterium]|nr:MAG: hypothetical protein A2238_01885 [Candidatus Nomurabacteria bacterium RIFOXYA2_FULL_35_9]OGJ15206.1 MAG: hypothetical protein A2554_03235 [Candidatus Nomurabacteria bacterium RIFOXYD2_FULL_35_12]HCH59867.1 hypothetical protein [Candidatus Zambryskibacteria bacterium]
MCKKENMKGKTIICFVLLAVLSLFLIVKNWTGITTFVSSGFWIPFIGWITICLLVGAGTIRLFGGKDAFWALFRKGGEDTWWFIFFASTVVTCLIALQYGWGPGLLLPEKGGVVESVWKPTKGLVIQASDGGLTILKPIFTGIAEYLRDPPTTTTTTKPVKSWFWSKAAFWMVAALLPLLLLAFKDNVGRWWEEAEKKAEAKAKAKLASTTTGTGASKEKDKVTEMEVLWLSVAAEFIKDAIVNVFKGFKKS